MRSPKYTAWKKNRRFGDIHGGRMRLKCTDNIFNRLHNFARPGPQDATPILIEDNPSSDYFFPLDGAECLEVIRALPKRDWEGITHLWLRRPTSRDRKTGFPFAEFICGSGVRLIVIYPWPKNLRWDWGRRRPKGKIINELKKFGAEVFAEKGLWYTKISRDGARQFLVQSIFHQVGYHVDWYYRKWTEANRQAAHNWADQYAMCFTREGEDVLDRLDQG